MSVITIRELLEAGVHFGHEARRWNPKMKPFIFEERNGIHIIDLQQTLDQVEEAYSFIRETVASGKTVLFVGTKRQAKDPIKEAAQKVGMFFVTERWLGGLLTNNKTIRKSIGRLREIEGLIQDGTMERLPKKEVSSLRREMARFERNLMGVKEMSALPGAIFIIDTKKEHIAVAEARRLHIPIVALVDTNCDPEEIDYPIVSNDDAIRAIKLVCDLFAQACTEGVRLRPEVEAEELTAKGEEPEEKPKRARARKPARPGGRAAGSSRPRVKSARAEGKETKPEPAVVEAAAPVTGAEAPAAAEPTAEAAGPAGENA